MFQKESVEEESGIAPPGRPTLGGGLKSSLRCFNQDYQIVAQNTFPLVFWVVAHSNYYSLKQELGESLQRDL